jgi:hypothetical protein
MKEYLSFLDKQDSCELNFLTFSGWKSEKEKIITSSKNIFLSYLFIEEVKDYYYLDWGPSIKSVYINSFFTKKVADSIYQIGRKGHASWNSFIVFKNTSIIFTYDLNSNSKFEMPDKIKIDEKFYNDEYEIDSFEELHFDEYVFENCLKIRQKVEDGFVYLWLDTSVGLIQYELISDSIYFISYLDKNILFQNKQKSLMLEKYGKK